MRDRYKDAATHVPCLREFARRSLRQLPTYSHTVRRLLEVVQPTELSLTTSICQPPRSRAGPLSICVSAYASTLASSFCFRPVFYRVSVDSARRANHVILGRTSTYLPQSARRREPGEARTGHGHDELIAKRGRCGALRDSGGGVSCVSALRRASSPLKVRHGRRQRPLLTWPFKIRTIAIIVFQFRVVAGTP
jgi:hypothetical protein